MPAFCSRCCCLLVAGLLYCGTATAQPTIDVVHAFPSVGALRPVGPLVRAANGTLYGASALGGAYNLGTVFALTTAGDVTVLHEFDGADGAGPAALILGHDSSLYGTTGGGGVGYDPESSDPSTGFGLVFRLAMDGTFTVLHKFTQADVAAHPGSLNQASDGVFYGFVGSPDSNVYVFRMQADGTVDILGMLPRGFPPTGPFLEVDGNFYVMTNSTQGYGFVCGRILKMTPAGEFTAVHTWFNNPSQVCLDHAMDRLIKGPGGYIYGATDRQLFVFTGTLTNFYSLPQHGDGDGFEGVVQGDDAGFYALSRYALYRVDGDGVNPIHTFAGFDGSLTVAPDGSLFGTTFRGGAFGLGQVFGLTAAGTVTMLRDMDPGTEGNRPVAPVMQAADGSLYGVTKSGGPHDGGTAFRSSTAGDVEVLHAFDEYSHPVTPLIQANTGDFYGTTFYSAFRVTPGGGFTSFGLTLPFLQQSGPGVTDGTTAASLVQAQDGQLYGTTLHTSASYLEPPNGTVFKMTLDGIFAVQHSFTNAEGAKPAGELLRGSDGYLYGTTRSLGGFGLGTVFKTTLDGAMTTLYSFSGGMDGASPIAPLMQAQNGSFFGTTPVGGGFGSVFAIAPAGGYSQLHRFGGGSGGAEPTGKLVQANDGNLYGTTRAGGVFDQGTVFRITPAGGFAVVHSFNGADGGHPHAGLILGADGHLYGTTEVGGPTSNGGVIYRVTLPPCTDTVMPSYNSGTLNLAFSLGSSTAATFSTWLVHASGVFSLWSASVPAISPIVSFNLPFAGFPHIGNVGFLTVLSAPTWSGACYDWQVVDTGGAGASASALEEQARRSGLIPST